MPTTFVDDIFAAFSLYGDRYGETVTQRQHALQSADLAQRDGARPSLVVAALLHDYGHSSAIRATPRNTSASTSANAGSASGWTFATSASGDPGQIVTRQSRAAHIQH